MFAKSCLFDCILSLVHIIIKMYSKSSGRDEFWIFQLFKLKGKRLNQQIGEARIIKIRNRWKKKFTLATAFLNSALPFA